MLFSSNGFQNRSINDQCRLKPTFQSGYPQLHATLITYAQGWTIVNKGNPSRSGSSSVSTWIEWEMKPHITKWTNLISEKLTLISAFSVLLPWMLSDNCGLTKLRPSFKKYNQRYVDFNVSLIEYSTSLKLWWREAGGLVFWAELVVCEILNWKWKKVLKNMPKIHEFALLVKLKTPIGRHLVKFQTFDSEAKLGFATLAPVEYYWTKQTSLNIFRRSHGNTTTTNKANRSSITQLVQ